MGRLAAIDPSRLWLCVYRNGQSIANMTSADNNPNGHAGCRARSNYVRRHLRATGREMNVNSNIATVSPP